MVPFLHWTVLAPRIRWDIGDHITIVGKTKAGKSTLAFDLARRRQFCVIIATKMQDDTLENVAARDGYAIETTWPDYAPPPNRIILKPQLDTIGETDTQERVIKEGLQRIFKAGKWTIVFDELWYTTNILNLGKQERMFLTQGRSLKISVMGLTQRPRFIPLEFYDQVQHLFYFRFKDKRDVEILADIGSGMEKQIRATVPNLRPHEFIYIHPDTDYMVRSIIPRR